MQRIINHFKSEWIKYVFETVVIILGVLIAIGFDDWKANIENDKIEQQTLENLHTDLGRAKIQLEKKINAVKRNIKSDSVLLLHIHKRRRISNDSLLKLISPTRFPPTYDPDDGTIQDILSTGKISLIHDIKLRTHISSWSKYINELKEVEQGILSHKITVVEKYNISKIPYRNGRFGHTNLAWDKERFLNSIVFENIHMQSYTMYKVLLNRYRKHQNDLKEMISLIKTE